MLRVFLACALLACASGLELRRVPGIPAGSAGDGEGGGAASTLPSDPTSSSKRLRKVVQTGLLDGTADTDSTTDEADCHNHLSDRGGVVTSDTKCGKGKDAVSIKTVEAPGKESRTESRMTEGGLKVTSDEAVNEAEKPTKLTYTSSLCKDLKDTEAGVKCEETVTETGVSPVDDTDSPPTDVSVQRTRKSPQAPLTEEKFKAPGAHEIVKVSSDGLTRTVTTVNAEGHASTRVEPVPILPTKSDTKVTGLDGKILSQRITKTFANGDSLETDVAKKR